MFNDPELGPRITGYTWPQRFQSLPATSPIFLVILIIFAFLRDFREESLNLASRKTTDTKLARRNALETGEEIV